MLNLIADFRPELVYPLIFLGHIFLGGIVLIPALYLSVTDTLSLAALFVTIIASSMVADSLWYLIGKNVRREKIYALAFIKRRAEEAKKFSQFFEKHGIRMVFLTKFVYGTRIASHLLAGIHRINFVRFLIATAAGSTVWFLVLFSLVKLLDVGVSETGSVALKLQIVFLGGVLFILLFNWYSKTFIRKRLMNPRKRK